MTGPDAAVAVALAEVVADPVPCVDDESLHTIELGVIDALACMVAGSREPACRKARATAVAVPGEQAPVVAGTVLRTTPAAAAFCNAMAGHVLEFDDWEVPGNTHPSIVLVPAILAAARQPVSGRRLAEAYARGFEVIARVGEAVNFEHYGRGWHTTATLGALGAAAAAAATLGLDRTATAHAISLACSRAAGLTAQFGSDAKALQAGFAAEAGVSAALLAAGGLCGRLDILERPDGFAAVTAGVGAESFKVPLSKLTAPWAVAEHGLVLKAYPTCGYTHRTIDAAIELRSALAEAGVRVQDIASMCIRLPDLHARILPFMSPRSAAEARFCLPFAAAVALLAGGLDLDHLRSASWNDPATAAMISRCTVEPFARKRPELNWDPDQPDQVVIKTRDGRVFEARTAFPLGSPQKPMTKRQVLDKAMGLLADDGIDSHPDNAMTAAMSANRQAVGTDQFFVADPAGCDTYGVRAEKTDPGGTRRALGDWLACDDVERLVSGLVAPEPVDCKA